MKTSEYIEELRRLNFHHVNDTDPSKTWSYDMCADMADGFAALESEVARLRGLVERMKPYLLGQDHDERWNQLLSDLEKGAG